MIVRKAKSTREIDQFLADNRNKEFRVLSDQDGNLIEVESNDITVINNAKTRGLA